MAISLKVNGVSRSVLAEPDTPLLYVLRNDLELNGAKFGCGLAQCGACMVLIDGMIMSAKELIDRNPRPSEQDVRAALEGNLCCCGTHNRIIRAVLCAAQANGRT